MNHKLLLFMILITTIAFLFPMTQKVQAVNPNLFVSAENSQFNNYFAGPQVIEVKIVDTDISATNEAKGEPDVTVNGKTLRMVQAVDGNWYAYFADLNMAQVADSTTSVTGKGLDFGKFCSNTTPSNVTGISLGDTAGFSLPYADSSGTDGTVLLSSCSFAGTKTILANHVIRNPPALNTALPDAGQIGITQSAWPLIQLYTLNPTGNVVIQYNKGGGTQTTTLTFDTVGQFANISADKTTLNPDDKITLSITDVQLNIDPTDIDSWTFATNPSSPQVHYQMFKGNNVDGDGNSNDIGYVLSSLMFENNGFLTIQNTDKILQALDNSNQVLMSDPNGLGTLDIPSTELPVTITETGVISDVFTNSDSSIANLKAVSLNSALAGKSSTILYNGISFQVIYNVTPSEDQQKYLDAYDGLFNTPQQKVNPPKIEDYANIPKPTPIPDPKIENSIYKLQSASNPQDFATKSGLQYKNGMVRILISGQINDSIISQINGLGTIETKSPTSIQAVVSPAKIQEISKISGVEKIRPTFLAFQNTITSEGVTFTKTDQAQNQGLSGKNIKIAVLDLAFDTSNSEISGSMVDSKSLRHDSGTSLVPVQGYGHENVHGTAVAEIIADMAPNADLFLYTFGSEMEFTDAVDAAMQQKVNLIAMSAGWMNYAADGKSDMTKKVEQVISKGIPFIVSSGNYAETHWEDKFADSDGNGWHEFKSNDEGLSFEVTQSRVSQQIPIVAYLMWSDSSSTVTDFNLSLTGPSGDIVYEASTVQSKKGDEFEYIYFTPDTAGTYSIGISHSGSSKPNATLEIFSQSDLLEYYTPAGSVSVPNDANGIISVGALNYMDSKLESFSSQGPTNNGKSVPSIMGPDAVNTKAYGEPFYGTSAAAPHVAGIVALMLEATPGLTPAQITSLLQEHADKSSLGISKNDNVYGYGKANASFLKPAAKPAPAATSDIVIPEWVRTNALWWHDKKIDDQTFASGIQFLIKQKIIIVPVTESGEKKDNIVIPEWVRTNAKWWYDGKIDDQTFASGLQFLIKSGIITV